MNSSLVTAKCCNTPSIEMETCFPDISLEWLQSDNWHWTYFRKPTKPSKKSVQKVRRERENLVCQMTKTTALRSFQFARNLMDKWKFFWASRDFSREGSGRKNFLSARKTKRNRTNFFYIRRAPVLILNTQHCALAVIVSKTTRMDV